MSWIRNVCSLFLLRMLKLEPDRGGSEKVHQTDSWDVGTFIWRKSG